MEKKMRGKIVAAAVAACALAGGCTALAYGANFMIFGRVEGFAPGAFYTYFTWDEIDQRRYRREETHFYSGRNRLQGFVYGMENDNGLVVISHGLGGTADAYFPLIMFFVDNGWRVFAFNNTGVAGSEGRNMRGLSQAVIDLDAALAFVRRTSAFDGLPVMIVGHSMGGYAASAVLNFGHDVRAVVSAAAFNDPWEIFREQGAQMAGGLFFLLSPHFRIVNRILFGGAARLSAIDGINKSGVPVMIVQCADDELIRADTTSIYAHREKIANPNVEIILRRGIGHEFVFSSPRQREYMARAASSWREHSAGREGASRLQWAREVGFCKESANELDADLMARINEFFLGAR